MFNNVEGVDPNELKKLLNGIEDQELLNQIYTAIKKGDTISLPDDLLKKLDDLNITDSPVIKIRIIDGVKEYNVKGEWVSQNKFDYLRQKAVAGAWKAEVELVKTTGKGSRDWTQAEIGELLTKGKVQGYEGQHMKSAIAYPDYVADPANIQFLKGRGGEGADWVNEHFDAHRRNWQNSTNGYYNPEDGTITDFGDGPPIIPDKE